MKLLTSLLSAIALIGCIESPSQKATSTSEVAASDEVAMDGQTSSLKTAYFASGCFWCVEAIFEHVEGVEDVVSGYSGGKEANPTYTEVSYGRTTHAEAVRVKYNSEKVSFATLVDVFFGSHDPTTLNRQGPDSGAQYRSIAFYQNPEEKRIIESKIDALNRSKVYDNPIVTQVVAFDTFYEAEEYHQDFEKRNPYHPYIQSVSIPRLNRFKRKFPQLLKKEH